MVRDSEDGRFDEFIVDINADCVCGCMDGDRFHKIYHFPNDYGASVVNNPKKAGFDQKGYRILILRFISDTEYTIVREPIFDSGILECSTWDDTVRSLQKIKDLS